MWEVVFLVVCLLLLALHWTTREHLEPTGNILGPAGTDERGDPIYTDDQASQIWANLPELLRNQLIEDERRVPFDQRERSAKRGAASTLAYYYKYGYQPASSTVTPSDIDEWRMAGGRGRRNLLIAYFVDGANPPPPPPAAETPPPPAAETPPPVPEPAPASVTSTPATIPEASPVPVPTTSQIELRSPTNITINVR